MTGYDRDSWPNHPHWEHRPPPPQRVSRHRIRAWLAPLLRKAHLPPHPAAGLGVIGAGLGYFLLISDTLADFADGMSGGDRALQVVSMALFAMMTLPGLGMVLTGVRDLAKAARRHRAQRLQR